MAAINTPDSMSSSDMEEKAHRSSHESSSGSSSDEALLKDGVDVEAQTRGDTPNPNLATEHTIPLRSKLLFLAAYFALNLGLTLSNKALLGRAKFPWLLTTLHASSTSIGCFLWMGVGSLKLTRLGRQENMVLIAFSVLFTLNIAISNVSLSMVSVPFHQIMRSTCPIVTIWIYRLVYGRTYSTSTYLSMIPLILGVALATAGDYYCTMMGFLLTALGVVLASVKTVATNRLMTGSLSLSAMEVLLRMSPLAAIQCVVYASLSGEVTRFRQAYSEGQFGGSFGLALVANAVVAFALNLVSFQTNKVAGALTMTVAANVKQALTIALGIVLFHLQVGPLNAVGTVVTMAGAVWYSKVELDNKRARARAAAQ